MCTILIAILGLGMTYQSHSDGAAERLAKIRAFVAAINANSQPQVETFLRKGFSAKVGKGSTFAARAAHLLGLAKLGVPFTIGKVLKDDPTATVVAFKNSRGEDWELKMNFETAPPHGAISVYVGGPGSQTSPPPKLYTHWKSLRELLEAIRADTHVPAIGIALAKGGRVESVVVGAREVGKPMPVEPGDRWLIGSITKSMTSMMIARLVDKGVLRWNMTIPEALPNTPIRPEYRKVTLLQLLQHRAGVQQDRYVTPDFLKEASGTYQTLEEARENYTRFTLNRDPIGKPGERMAYSNAGYAIAAHMAEVAAKQPYEKLMQTLVFDPLGMKSARMGVPGTPGNPGAEGEIDGHVQDGDHLIPHVIDEPKLNAIQEAAGAGVSMSVEDLLKFARYHLAGLRGHVTLMSAKTFHVLHQPADTSPGAYKYACGWVLDDVTTKHPFHGHNGSDGTFWAEIAIWPEKDFAAVAISNAANKLAESPPMQAILAAYDRYCP